MTGATYLWQNFLNNPKIIEFIVQDIKKNCNIVNFQTKSPKIF